MRATQLIKKVGMQAIIERFGGDLHQIRSYIKSEIDNPTADISAVMRDIKNELRIGTKKEIEFEKSVRSINLLLMQIEEEEKTNERKRCN